MHLENYITVHLPMWAGEIGFPSIKAENGKTERNIYYERLIAI